MKLESAEILTSGWCPNNCRYCYIPKSEEMKGLHEKIIESLKDGSYIKKLIKIYGKDLTSLGFWGTEPALTLDIIKKILPELFKKFPKLKNINFSTSLIMVEPIERFIEAFSKYKDKKLGIQISIDGPAFITDRNRFPGAAQKIPFNFYKLVFLAEKTKAKVNFQWKATLTMENIKEFNKDPSKINKYYDFFERMNKKFRKINKNSNITLSEKSYVPTLAVPGKYTSKDGKDFAKFLKNLREKGYKSTYSFRLERLMNFWGELYNKKRMFTCSGGDSNLGLGKNIHICHRSFYLDEEKYVQSVLKKTDIENWDMSYFNEQKIDMLKKSYIVSPLKKAEKDRFFYVMRNYHDFWGLQIGYINAMMIELALSGQANKSYLKEELRNIFAIFMCTALSCPMENLLNTGVIHFTPLSLLKMFGNGAFQELIYDLPRRKQ